MILSSYHFPSFLLVFHPKIPRFSPLPPPPNVHPAFCTRGQKAGWFSSSGESTKSNSSFFGSRTPELKPLNKLPALFGKAYGKCERFNTYSTVLFSHQMKIDTAPNLEYIYIYVCEFFIYVLFCFKTQEVCNVKLYQRGPIPNCTSPHLKPPCHITQHYRPAETVVVSVGFLRELVPILVLEIEDLQENV